MYFTAHEDRMDVHSQKLKKREVYRPANLYANANVLLRRIYGGGGGRSPQGPRYINFFFFMEKLHKGCHHK